MYCSRGSPFFRVVVVRGEDPRGAGDGQTDGVLGESQRRDAEGGRGVDRPRRLSTRQLYDFTIKACVNY